MMNLTFGEQVKIVLNRKGMTIKDLAELIEKKTGRKCPNKKSYTAPKQKKNFQEQDMRQIAEILGCPFQLGILEESEPVTKPKKEKIVERESDNRRLGGCGESSKRDEKQSR